MLSHNTGRTHMEVTRHVRRANALQGEKKPEESTVMPGAQAHRGATIYIIRQISGAQVHRGVTMRLESQAHVTCVDTVRHTLHMHQRTHAQQVDRRRMQRALTRAEMH